VKAGYADDRGLIEALKNTNYEFTLPGLAHVWNMREEELGATVQRLMRIGLFHHKANLKQGNIEVSFVYRRALELESGLYRF
jgi:hypothetical protein